MHRSSWLLILTIGPPYPHRALLRSQSSPPLPVPLSLPRTSNTVQCPLSGHSILLPKRRKALRVLPRHQRAPAVLSPGDIESENGKRRRYPKGKGALRTELPDRTRGKQRNQDGSGDRGLSAHRVRVQQEQVSCSNRGR